MGGRFIVNANKHLEEKEMSSSGIFKKTAFGLVWFLVFWGGGTLICAAIAGALAEPDVAEQAGIVFYDRYGLFVVLGSMGLAGVGSYLGKLPGTKTK